MQWSIRLKTHKPKVLQKTEKRIWKVILDIVNQPSNFLTILNDLTSAFPSSYTQELLNQSDTMAAWFNVDSQHSKIPASAESDSQKANGNEVVYEGACAGVSTLLPPSLLSLCGPMSLLTQIDDFSDVDSEGVRHGKMGGKGSDSDAVMQGDEDDSGGKKGRKGSDSDEDTNSEGSNSNA